MYGVSCTKPGVRDLKRTYRQKTRYCYLVQNQEMYSQGLVVRIAVNEDHGTALQKEILEALSTVSWMCPEDQQIQVQQFSNQTAR